MTGVGDVPRNLAEYIRTTDKRIVALERRRPRAVAGGGGGGGLDAEAVRDLIGATLVAGTGMTITVNDAGDTVTIAGAPWSARTAFTPSITGLTLGTGGTAVGNLQIVGSWAFVDITITLGTTPTVGDVVVAWPAGASGAGLPDLFPVGRAMLLDISAGASGRFVAEVYKGLGARIVLTSTAAGLTTVLTSSAPFVWTATDQMILSLHYPIV